MNTQSTTNVTELTSEELTTVEETSVAETTAVETTTVEHGIGFTPEGLEFSLPIMGKGMLGIFIVTSIIVAVTVILNKATAPRKPKEKKDK
ncbi:MAG: hypothetical protein IIW48_03535 [Clostridia bacterium]|nr:hypothetical protein [Clostridia bacterium]